MPAGSASMLRLCTGVDETRAALSAALAGGPPVAPLPTTGSERSAALTMLRPEVEVAEPAAAAVVATSGSTGVPKGVLLSRSAVRAAVEATHAQLGGPLDWVLTLPVHYVAGLMVLARTVVAGTELTSIDSVEALPPAGPRSGVALVATQLARALAKPALSDRLAGYATVLLGGSAAPPDLLSAARAGGINVVSTYGMSETCGGCVYDGVALPGVRLRLDESARISLAGPTVFSGYRLDPVRTAEVLADGWFHTSDRGHLDGDGRLVVDGRIDDVVISGGLNVDLAAVARIARAVTGSEVAVLGLPDPQWGSLVVAVTEHDIGLDELRAAMGERLPAYALPRRVVRVPALPRLSSGKIDRQRLLRTISSPEEGPFRL